MINIQALLVLTELDGCYLGWSDIRGKREFHVHLPLKSEGSGQTIPLLSFLHPLPLSLLLAAEMKIPAAPKASPGQSHTGPLSTEFSSFSPFILPLSSSSSLQPLALPLLFLSQASLPVWCLGLCGLPSCSPTANTEAVPALIPRPSNCTAAQISLVSLTCAGVKPLNKKNIHTQNISEEPQSHSGRRWQHDLSWFLVTMVNLQHLLSSLINHKLLVVNFMLLQNIAHPPM